MAFDPRDHLMKLKGKDYLPVAARLMWLNTEARRFTIGTEFIELNDTYSVARATVTLMDDEGRVLKSATATKREDKKDFLDHESKAETGAVGRALGMLGFGTQFAPEFDEMDAKAEPRVVDTPVEPPKPAVRPPAPAEAPSLESLQVPAAGRATLTTAAKIGAPTNKRKPVATDEPEPEAVAPEPDLDDAGPEYDHGAVEDEDLFSEPKVKRLTAIGGKLFNLKGEALETRLIEAASKILGQSVVDLHALHFRDGDRVMKALEEQAVKRGLWEAARA